MFLIIYIFSIGGTQTLPIKSEQWSGKKNNYASSSLNYGSVEVKCTNIAGKAILHMNALSIVKINSFHCVYFPNNSRDQLRSYEPASYLAYYAIL